MMRSIGNFCAYFCVVIVGLELLAVGCLMATGRFEQFKVWPETLLEFAISEEEQTPLEDEIAPYSHRITNSGIPVFRESPSAQVKHILRKIETLSPSEQISIFQELQPRIAHQSDSTHTH